jgi:subtilisin family serine protease
MDKKQTSEYKPYVIQFQGKIGLPERQRLEALEVLLCEYYPPGGFLARMQDTQLEDVKKLPFVTDAVLLGAEQKFSGGMVKVLAAMRDRLDRSDSPVIPSAPGIPVTLDGLPGLTGPGTPGAPGTQLGPESQPSPPSLSVSDSPPGPPSPGTPGAPGTPDTPGTQPGSESQISSPSLSTPDSQPSPPDLSVSDSPDGQDSPPGPPGPGTPDAPGTPDTPGTQPDPEGQLSPPGPDTPDSQPTLSTPGTPSAPSVPPGPSAPPSSSAPPAPGATTAPGTPTTPGTPPTLPPPGTKKKLIVKLFENAGAQAVAGFVRAHGGSVSGPDRPGGQWLEIELQLEQLTRLASLHEVRSIEEKGEYELYNNRAGDIVRAPSLWDKGFTGAGQTIGIADTGLDTGVRETLHPDLQSRLLAIYALGIKGDAGDYDGHGTHVAGSAVGEGCASQGLYRGMAPAAKLVFQAVRDKKGKLSGIPSDLGVLLKQAYEAGARIYNASWGMSANGAYNYAAAQMDTFVWEHDDMAVAVAAGNDGQAGSISSPGTAKNVITVGASENNRPEKGNIADNPAELAFFSSRGPASDGRCKPDIVAPGTWILSTRSSLAQPEKYWGVEGQYYAYSSGTSMATPIVAGMLALVREYFVRVSGCEPCAALLKAALLDGAFVLPGYMENEEGWGRLNAPDPAINPARECLFVNQETKLATGESKTYEYLLSGTAGPLRITLAWTDYPAQVNAAVALVNDLDLTVQSPSGQIFSPGDHLNNVEQVVFPDPEAGLYKVTVSGYHVPMGYQHYALFVSGKHFS